jgi:hypothetical protein
MGPRPYRLGTASVLCDTANSDTAMTAPGQNPKNSLGAQFVCSASRKRTSHSVSWQGRIGWSYCKRCTGTMSGGEDLSTHYAPAELLSGPRRNSWLRRNSAPHLARFTAILAALASPLTSILTPFHASGLRLRVRDHQHGRERGYCSRQAQRRKKLPPREPRLRARGCSRRPRGCDADRALLELWLDDAVA